MKLKDILIALAVNFVVISVFVIFYFLTAQFVNKPQEQKIELIANLKWRKCYDNDTSSFSQEYTDKDFEKNLSNSNKKYKNSCVVERQGNQDIIGCSGDLYYSFSCY